MELTESHRHQVQMAQNRAARAYEAALEALATHDTESIGAILKETDLAKSIYAWAAAYATVPGEEDEPDSRRLTLEEEREAAMLMAATAGVALGLRWSLAEYLLEIVSYMEPDE